MYAPCRPRKRLGRMDVALIIFANKGVNTFPLSSADNTYGGTGRSGFEGMRPGVFAAGMIDIPRNGVSGCLGIIGAGGVDHNPFGFKTFRGDVVHILL